ncbi:MAG: hypothetical protein DWI21_15795 [Planctomycetota bacterium]|nr:MAG: hypothetical protein DWI21_15795 [Planctomycetota bacterium]GDY08661.1 hypothetical protein LBMAG52_21470 [Planctomycetia bacterium]
MIAQFALRLICGMSLMWALMPRRQVTSGFFRIQMLVVMGLGVLAALTVGMELRSVAEPPHSTFIASVLFLASAPAVLIAVLGFFGSVLWTLERRTGAERIGFGVLFVSTALIFAPVLIPRFAIDLHDASVGVVNSAASSASHPLIEVASEFAGAAVLGSTVVGMLLGHWYLTTPTMSIEPLKRLNLFLGIAGVLRLIVSAAVVLMLWGGVFDSAETNSRLAAVPKAWLGLRWLAGVIGPIVVSLMVWRILKYRNTQAATGVLFVGVILAFIGDMTAALLLSQTKLPF